MAGSGWCPGGGDAWSIKMPCSEKTPYSVSALVKSSVSLVPAGGPACAMAVVSASRAGCTAEAARRGDDDRGLAAGAFGAGEKPGPAAACRAASVRVCCETIVPGGATSACVGRPRESGDPSRLPT